MKHTASLLREELLNWKKSESIMVDALLIAKTAKKVGELVQVIQKN